MKNKRDPLPSQIQSGYYASKAVNKATEYFGQSLECITQAIIDTNEDGVKVENVELGDFRGAIYSALAALQDVEKAHLRLSKQLKKKGYRAITSEDFEEFGVTRR